MKSEQSATEMKTVKSTLHRVNSTTVRFLHARRYASAGTSYGPVSVSASVSVCHKSVFYRNGWTE